MVVPSRCAGLTANLLDPRPASPWSWSRLQTAVCFSDCDPSDDERHECTSLKADDVDAKLSVAGNAYGAIEPFQFRVRGTAARKDGDQSLSVQRPPRLHSFSWGFSQTAHLLALSAKEGEWTNWTAFTHADLEAAATRDTRTAGFPHLVLSLDGTWAGASTVPAPFAKAVVEVEFAPTVAPDTSVTLPVTATIQLSATLGFSARSKSCVEAQCGTLGLLVNKISTALSVITFREFNNANYYSIMAKASLAALARPRLFPLIDRIITDSDVENEQLGLVALSGLGFTGMASSHANGPDTKAVFSKASLQFTTTGMRESDDPCLLDLDLAS